MVRYLKKLDAFSRNIILVFIGTSLINIFNLLYQLLIAHRLSPADFAAFNSLLSIFMVVSAPLGTLQTAVAKYTAEFNAHGQINKVKFLLSNLLKKTAILSVLTCLAAYFASLYLIDILKIPSFYSAYVLVLLVSLYWIIPVLIGTLQGLELFNWFMAVLIFAGAAKLLFAFIFIRLGFNITGALGAFLVSALLLLIMSAFALKGFISFNADSDGVNFKQVVLYMFPVAITIFCWTSLTNMDMVLARYYFRPGESGIYAIAQMVGKISLFLPGAISIVMFPKTSGLNAKQNNTTPILNRSLAYAAILCVLFGLAYNLLPAFILKVLTGKVLPGSIILGRLFSVSMTFFALLFIIAAYFLSIKDLRFIKYLVVSTILQALAIVFFHHSLIQIQWILCINAVLLFLIHLALAVFKKR
jgi:O-antigen/teichoic acid export membrane protein